MKHSKYLLAPLLFAALSLNSFATETDKAKAENSHEHEEKEGGHEHGANEEEHEEEGSSDRVGPGKAIIEASKATGIKLSEKASKTIGLRSEAVSSENVHRFPPTAIVYFQDEVGVYRFRDGWYKLIEGKIEKKSTTEVLFKSSEIKVGDQVVVEGTALLRATELEAWGGSGDGHGH